MLDTGKARRNQSPISFNVVKERGEILNQRSCKRLGRNTEDLTPKTLVSQASTSIITDDTNNSNLLTTKPKVWKEVLIKCNSVSQVQFLTG